MQSDYFLVEKIIAKKKSGKSIKYLVKWVDFPLEQSTWEPIENLENVKLLINEFEKSHKENLNLDYNPVKKSNVNENEEISDSDDSKTDSDIEPKSNESNSSKSNELSEKSSNKSSPIIDNKPNKIDNSSVQKPLKADDDDESNLLHDLDTDEPLRVVDSKMDHKRKVICYIEWKVRSDGMKPDSAYVSTDVLKEKFPKFLIDYYESRIKFVK